MAKIDPADKDWEDAGVYKLSDIDIDAVDPRVKMLWERWENLCWNCGQREGGVIVLNRRIKIHEIWCVPCVTAGYAK